MDDGQFIGWIRLQKKEILLSFLFTEHLAHTSSGHTSADVFANIKQNIKSEHVTRTLLKTVLTVDQSVNALQPKGLPTGCRYSFDFRHKSFFLSLM